MRWATNNTLIRFAVMGIFFGSALAIWFFPAFPTVDGSTHSLTAKMILDGLEGHPDPNTSVGSYWVPNALGHYALVGLQTVLAPPIAERALIFLIVLGLGIGLFRLCQALGQPLPWAALLALPFGWNFLLVMGFYNFLLGMALALFVLAFIFKREQLNAWAWGAAMIGALAVLWCHVMAFFFLALVMTVQRCVQDLPRLRLRSERIAALRSLGSTLLLLLPGTLVFLSFTGAHNTHWGEADPGQNLSELASVRVLVLYAFHLDKPYVLAFTLIIALLFGVAVGDRIRRDLSSVWKLPSFTLFLSAGIVLVLYFVLPDSTGYASFISLRLQLMLFLLIIGWIGTQLHFRRWSIAVILAVLVVHGARLKYARFLMKPHALPAAAIAEASRNIPAGHNVLPINFEREWLLAHQATQLGFANDIHVIENYECGMGYFPLVWREDLPGELYWHLMKATDRQCFEWLRDYVDAGQVPSMDHIALLGPIDSTSCKAQNVLPLLATRYQRTFDNGYVRVYSLK